MASHQEPSYLHDPEFSTLGLQTSQQHSTHHCHHLKRRGERIVETSYRFKTALQTKTAIKLKPRNLRHQQLSCVSSPQESTHQSKQSHTHTKNQNTSPPHTDTRTHTQCTCAMHMSYPIVQLRITNIAALKLYPVDRFSGHRVLIIRSSWNRPTWLRTCWCLEGHGMEMKEVAKVLGVQVSPAFVLKLSGCHGPNFSAHNFTSMD